MNTSIKNIFLPYAPVSARQVSLLLAAQTSLVLLFWCFARPGALPGPLEIAQAWVSLARDQGLLVELWESVRVLLLALGISSLLSVAMVCAATAPAFAPAARLYSVLRFLGFAGLTYVFMLMTKDGWQLKLALLVFGITVMMVTSMLAEVDGIAHEAVDHCRTLGMKHWRITWELVVLGKADVFLDLIRQNAAVGWTLLTMVEGLARSQGGIGALLLNQNRYFLLAGVFAIQLTILGYGLAQDWLLKKLREALCPYSPIDHARMNGASK